MKKNITLPIAIIACAITTCTIIACNSSTYALGQLRLSDTVNDFVKDKNVSVTRSMERDFDPEGPTIPRKEWQITHYTFDIKSDKAKKLIEQLQDAYDLDVSFGGNTYIQSAYQQSGDNINYSIEYSNVRKPLILTTENGDMQSLLVSGMEKDGGNTVIAILWREENVDNKPITKGDIYIVYRDPSFVRIKANDISNVVKSENIKRLEFYLSKYADPSTRIEGITNIINATIFVVDDIIRNGTENDKRQAQEILDNMLLLTPVAQDDMSPNLIEVCSNNSKTLQNLILRLGSNYNPAKFESTPNTFTIEGHIDEGLWDIGYYIYQSDDDMIINTNESELITADGNNFFYHTELQEVKLGRVRALFKDGTVCSAWIEMLFVPGETAELSVHNGFYSLTGSGFYKQFNEARNHLFGSEEDRMAYAMGQGDNPGALCYIFKEGRFDKSQLKEIYGNVADTIKSSAYGVYLRKFL